MLYHYTDRISGAEIRTAGVIRAAPITLHQDMLAQDSGFVTPPIVWLTTSPEPDPTVWTKLRAAGWPLAPGDIWRVTVPGDYADALPLSAWSDSVGIDPAWWHWTIKTAALVGSYWRDWRVVPHDLIASDWLDIDLAP